MNDTKWDEIRRSICALPIQPAWRTKDLSGYVSDWDREWYYHFRNGGYDTIEWVEIRVADGEEPTVEEILKDIHVPGHRIVGGFRVYGHVEHGSAIHYIERTSQGVPPEGVV